MKKITLLLLFFLTSVVLVSCQREPIEVISELTGTEEDRVFDPFESRNAKAGLQIVSETVDYYSGETVANGYLAQPLVGGPYPGLILIHEWWGLNDNIKELTDQFAKEGYVALAVDLYDGEVTGDRDKARELATAVRENMIPAFANLNEAVEYLKSQPQVRADSLASVGWCFGGGWSYQMAKNNLSVASSVIYYGQFNPEDDLSLMRGTILGHFGEEDATIKVDDVKAFEATLKNLGRDHQVFIYENSGHAFANEDSSAYVKDSAESAWMRTLDFLDRTLD